MKRREFTRLTFTAFAALGVPLVLEETPVDVYLTNLSKRFIEGEVEFPRIIGEDWAVSASGDIRYVGEGRKYTVLELHRWLANLFDEPCMMTEPVPTHRITDEIIDLTDSYTLTDEAAAHLYNGTIRTKDGIWSSHLAWG